MTSAFLSITGRKSEHVPQRVNIFYIFLLLSILLATFNIVFFPHSKSIKLTFDSPHFQMGKLRHSSC